MTTDLPRSQNRPAARSSRNPVRDRQRPRAWRQASPFLTEDPSAQRCRASLHHAEPRTPGPLRYSRPAETALKTSLQLHFRHLCHNEVNHLVFFPPKAGDRRHASFTRCPRNRHQFTPPQARRDRPSSGDQTEAARPRPPAVAPPRRGSFGTPIDQQLSRSEIEIVAGEGQFT